MNGLLTVEGLFAADWDASAMASIAPLLALEKDFAILNGGCTFQNHTSFKQWHSTRWFAAEPPIPLRSSMASSFIQAGAPKGVGTAVASAIGNKVIAMNPAEIMQVRRHVVFEKYLSFALQ